VFAGWSVVVVCAAAIPDADNDAISASLMALYFECMVNSLVCSSFSGGEAT
jgi:hypothetical protein